MTREEELQVAIASLLRGPIYAEEDTTAWNAANNQYGRISDLARTLGLQVVVDELNEFAFLRGREDLPEGMPRLVRRHSLTLSVTQLLVRLRQRQIAAESSEATPRLILTKEELMEEARLHHPPGTKEERLQADITRLKDLGYLKLLRGDTETFEVRRIIKAVVTADWLQTYLETLQTVPAGAARPPAVGAVDAPREG